VAKLPVNHEQDGKKQIRVSVGTAIVLGLLEGKLDAEPTTAYLMSYKPGKCTANCGFCPQAKTSQSKTELLSRVSWPAFPVDSVIAAVGNAVKAGAIRRVCVQTLNYPEAFSDLCSLASTLKKHVSVPLSVSCQPMNAQNLWSLHQAGVDRIGIALDAATEKIFDKVKGENAGGPYRWQDEFTLLKAAIGIFGEGNVSTHLIAGLGETEKEAAELLQKCVNIGVLPGLFAFTPVRGTALEKNPPPKLNAYRRLQLARYLIVNSLTRFDDMLFSASGQITDFGVSEDLLIRIVESGKPFLTSGCPDCNRPFYNEKPSGPMFNYPRALSATDTAEIKLQLNIPRI
jgi:biotin synthase